LHSISHSLIAPPLCFSFLVITASCCASIHPSAPYSCNSCHTWSLAISAGVVLPSWLFDILQISISRPCHSSPAYITSPVVSSRGNQQAYRLCIFLVALDQNSTSSLLSCLFCSRRSADLTVCRLEVCTRSITVTIPRHTTWREYDHNPPRAADVQYSQK